VSGGLASTGRRAGAVVGFYAARRGPLGAPQGRGCQSSRDCRAGERDDVAARGTARKLFNCGSCSAIRYHRSRHGDRSWLLGSVDRRPPPRVFHTPLRRSDRHMERDFERFGVHLDRAGRFGGPGCSVPTACEQRQRLERAGAYQDAGPVRPHACRSMAFERAWPDCKRIPATAGIQPAQFVRLA